MISYWEDYGCDADGNRSARIRMHEIDSEDDEDIKDSILVQLMEDEYDFNDSITVTLSSHMGEEVDFEVDISTYLSEEEFNKVQFNDN